MQDGVLLDLRLQAYRFALKVKPRQRQLLRQFAGACRYVANRGLALQQEFYELTGVHAGYADLCAVVTGWKQDPETAWLNAMPSQALQQSLKDLESGWKRYFDGLAARPSFRKKGDRDSFRYPQGCNLDQANQRIFLPKLGWVRYRSSRAVKGTVKNVTVSLSGGRWFVSIQTERKVERPVHPSTSEVGIDLGVVRLATLSNGEVIEPASAYGKQSDRLRKAQQSLSRKKKFSRNWKKARARVQRVHTRIANARRDFLHKTTTAISKNHAVVYVEDLKVKNMSRSAKGNLAKPGKNVRAKSGLNRAILDQGWAEFRRQLGYKLNWKGGELIVVPPHYTSQTCPACDHVSSANRRTQAEFACVECGYRNHADLVGAINVLRAGHARIACEVSSAVRLPAAGTSLSGHTGSTPVMTA
jgi:putative transposase